MTSPSQSFAETLSVAVPGAPPGSVAGVTLVSATAATGRNTIGASTAVFATTVTTTLPIESGGPWAPVVGYVRALSPTAPTGSATVRTQVIVPPATVQFEAPLPTSATVAGIGCPGGLPLTLVTAIRTDRVF